MRAKEFIQRMGHKDIALEVLVLTLGTTPEDHACWRQHRAWARETLEGLEQTGREILKRADRFIGDTGYVIASLDQAYQRRPTQEAREDLDQTMDLYVRALDIRGQVQGYVKRISKALAV